MLIANYILFLLKLIKLVSNSLYYDIIMLTTHYILIKLRQNLNIMSLYINFYGEIKF